MLWTDFGRFGRGWDPFGFDGLTEGLDRMLSLSLPAGKEFPPVNIWARDDAAVVTTEIPGLEPKDVDLAVSGKTLTIRGSRKAEELGEGETFHRRERWYGQFSKTIDLPFPVEGNKVEARFTRGILSVTLPRAEADKPRKIKVTTE